MGKSLKIMVAEDSQAIREVLCADLKKDGHEVTAKIDGATAWTYLSENSAGTPCVDLVLSDLNMPQMTGFDLLKKIRGDARFATLPFFILTTQSEFTSVLSAVEEGASGFLIKPVNMTALRQKIAPFQR